MHDQLRAAKKNVAQFFFGGIWKIVQVLEIDVLERERLIEKADGVATPRELALIESVCLYVCGDFCADCKFPFSVLWPEIAVACGLRNQLDFLQVSGL